MSILRNPTFVVIHKSKKRDKKMTNTCLTIMCKYLVILHVFWYLIKKHVINKAILTRPKQSLKIHHNLNQTSLVLEFTISPERLG